MTAHYLTYRYQSHWSHSHHSPQTLAATDPDPPRKPPEVGGAHTTRSRKARRRVAAPRIGGRLAHRALDVPGMNTARSQPGPPHASRLSPGLRFSLQMGLEATRIARPRAAPLRASRS